MRRPALVALITSLVIVACAMKPSPVTPAAPFIAMHPRDAQGLSLSAEATDQAYWMMLRGIREQKEPAACVSGYRVWTEGATRKVDVYALTLALVDSVDELHVWYHGSHLCADSLPSVHGHVSRQWVLPSASPTDSATAQRFRAPFHLILYRIESDTSIGVTLYWRTP